jgi:hypothetical protein
LGGKSRREQAQQRAADTWHSGVFVHSAVDQEP